MLREREREREREYTASREKVRTKSDKSGGFRLLTETKI